MKATITFEYDPMNNDEVTFVETIQNGDHYKAIVEDTFNYLREKLKYDSSLDEAAANAYQDVRDRMRSYVAEYNLDLF